MSKRSYEQYCPLARSLDLVGERWTLLVIRELITGPKRYTDLRNGLAGIASDILTQRLRDLEAAGLIARRELPPPAASTVYELTDRGRELEPALVGLARFGLGLLGEPPSADDPPPIERFGLLLRVLFEADAAPAEPQAIAVESGGRRISLSYGAGGLELYPEGSEPPQPPAATIAGEAPAVYELMLRRIPPSSERLRIEGDPRAVERMLAAFPAPASATA